MGWNSIAILAAVAVPLAAVLGTTAARAEDPPRVSGPFVHENLAVYLVHGPSAAGPVPLTLAEALTAGKVIVHETGSVNRLTIENTGTEEVFVQAGDIVKGGQQDRVLTVSFLVPPASGRLDIGAYCVEQGRWSARGKEDVKRFASSDKTLPSRDAKLALLAPAKPKPVPSAPVAASSPSAEPSATPGRTTQSIVRGRPTASGGDDTGSRQGEVWQSVSTAQRKLSGNLGASVAAPTSASSLQLSLENERLIGARKAYEKALAAAGSSADDIVGYVVAIGGRLNGADVYGSNGLFRKMWMKQLEGAVTEAIAEKDATSTAAPSLDDVRAFLARAEAGRSEQTKLPGAALERETRDSDKAVLAETRKSGKVLHRAYVARQ
jgi:hypothetical protein